MGARRWRAAGSSTHVASCASASAARAEQCMILRAAVPLGHVEPACHVLTRGSTCCHGTNASTSNGATRMWIQCTAAEAEKERDNDLPVERRRPPPAPPRPPRPPRPLPPIMPARQAQTKDAQVSVKPSAITHVQHSNSPKPTQRQQSSTC
jgi:hypothetical protein